MPQKWSEETASTFKKELEILYVKENKTIGEIAEILGLSETGVFDRLKRLRIKTTPFKKENYLNKKLVVIPKNSESVAEFIGILLGDGHISKFQTVVTLGNKEFEYAQHVSSLFHELFGIKGTISRRKTNYIDVYLGSVDIVRWLLSNNLTSNKVRDQVDVPFWIQQDKKYSKCFLRGFFDTDGSVYKLRFGIQISFTNHSVKLLKSTRNMLLSLGYKVSKINSHKVYITEKASVDRFFKEIKPMNSKHVQRYTLFKNASVAELVNRA